MTAEHAGGVDAPTAAHLRVRVLYDATDATSVVYPANDLKTFERARALWLTVRGLWHQGGADNRGMAFTLTNAEIALRAGTPEQCSGRDHRGVRTSARARCPGPRDSPPRGLRPDSPAHMSDCATSSRRRCRRLWATTRGFEQTRAAVRACGRMDDGLKELE